jgi:hypothetical protein
MVCAGDTDPCDVQIFGHTGMKDGGAGSAQWANYPGTDGFVIPFKVMTD